MKEKSEVFAGLVADLVGSVPMDQAVKLLECAMIERALEQSGGNQSAASRMLEIHRNTLQKKRHAYGLDGDRPRRRKPAAREGRAKAASRRRKTGAA